MRSIARFFIAVLLLSLPSYAAIALAQAGIAKQCTSCTTNNTIVYGSNTAGNTLVVVAAVCGSTLSTLVDTKSDTFTADFNTTIGGGGCNLYFRHASSIAGGASNTITATAAGTVSFFTVLSAEFSGVTNTSPYDSNGVVANGSSVSPAVSITPTVANELIVGYGGGSANITSTGSYSVAAVPSPTTGDVMIYRVAPASGAQSVTFTQANGVWDAAAVSYKAAAAAGGSNLGKGWIF